MIYFAEKVCFLLDDLEMCHIQVDGQRHVQVF